MTSLYNDLLDFLFFCILVACIFLNIYIFSIGSFLWFFFCESTHGLSFHFYLYSVKEETHFILQNLRNLSLFIAILSRNFY